MDGRNAIRRPRTVQSTEPFTQAQGYPGMDPVSKRTMDPVRTFETPLTYFPADIAIPALTQITIPLPPRCFQVAFIDVLAGCWASFNGGGSRKIKDGFVYNGDISSLEVLTDATGAATIQLACY